MNWERIIGGTLMTLLGAGTVGGQVRLGDVAGQRDACSETYQHIIMAMTEACEDRVEACEEDHHGMDSE